MNLDELLLTVQKPGRYVGGEWNAVKKEWTSDKIKVLLAFPDAYEVGMSHLGIKILYAILNERDDCLCERVFSPWPDFESVLRKNGMSLFSLESRRPIKEFDIIGISLAYELTFTNVLNLLDLGGIPKESSLRGEGDPIIIAGGPSAYNPEPMAEFIDAFLIGDGEEAIGEMVEAYKRVGSRGFGVRRKILEEMSKIKGVYVPSLYKDGPPKIKKRFINDLDKAPYPVRQIVPNIQIVHDRIAIEIMRGCKHACKFCQASAIYRPCRERSGQGILKLAKETYAMTGYDEISLLSLSSIDHSRIKSIIESLNEEFSPKKVSVSVPSLRIEDALKDLPLLISKVKKAGLTFAPECGSEVLRKFIDKRIDIEKLFEAAGESFRAGWKRVKLYFMIGLPTESDDDILKIAELIEKISDMKKKIDGRPAHVSASINSFIPKPHTPLERHGMDEIGELARKRALLRKNIKSRMVEIDFHSFEMSYVEAVLSRGDRKVSRAVHEAWKSGARFDGWTEQFRFDVWMESFARVGLDPASYIGPKNDPAEKLPWDFIVI